MASYPYPPQSGSIFRYKNKLYRVKTIDSDTESVFLELINDKGDVLNNDVPPIGRKQWDSRNYEEISSKGKKENEGKENKSSLYTISFDPETGDIMIKHPDGIKSERIKGLKGKDGESVFSEWARKKGIINPTQQDWEDFINSLRGKDGQSINGKDAPSPYEEWLGRQPKDAAPEEKSYTAFIRSITGAKGKDGYEGRDGLSAFEVWKSIQPNGDSLTEKDFFDFLKGDTGKNGHEGVDGKDGDTWKPYVSEEGILYFENTRTGERTKRVNIKGLQGPGADKGANGDTWEPYFPDDGKHQLYFKNQKGEILGPFDVVGATGKTGPQGPRGESAYQIWLNEGNKGDFHDFLLWIAKQAQKGDNGKDGDTFRPHIEKGGHLFFVSTKTGERIDGGWVKGDKGDQGETGLNGHNVTHKYGYKEIYDWTCPVQEINPHLLASSDDLASGGSAEKHMRETLNRIKNIRKQGEKKENRGSWIQEAFWWCSGADTRLLRMCPAEHSKYMGIGTVIFFTALMAMFSSYIAISYVFGGIDPITGDMKWSWFAGCFAFMWGLMIFFLDRFITNTMYSDGKVTISWLELRSALPRILISIFLGIVISAPLELKIFKHEIDDKLQLTQEKFVKDQFAEALILNNDSIQKCDSLILDIKANQAKIPTFEKALQEARADLKRESQKNYSSGGAGMPQRGNYSTSQEFSAAVRDWKTAENASNDVAQSKRDAALAPYKSRVQELEDTIASLTNGESEYEIRKSQYETNRRNLLAKEQEALDSINVNKAGLYDRLSALHAIAYQEGTEEGYHDWDWVKSCWGWISCGIFVLLVLVSSPFLKNVVKGDEDDDGKSAPVKDPNLKGGLVLYPWFAVTALICGYFANTLFNALPYYIFTAVGMIMMLFILIDVSPVFYKMMLADGQYEQYHHKEKSITQDLVRLNFAKSIAKVNESEIGRLAPLIFSKPFKKIKHILTKADNIQKEELGWIVKDRDGNVIETAHESIRVENRDVFDTVLSMKKAIIEASYQAWYRDMRDAIIGMHKPGKPNGGNTPIDDTPNDPRDPSARARRDTGHHTSDDEPFDEENYYGNTTGTSPDYDASSDDPLPETPEDFLNEEDSHLNNHTDEGAGDTNSDEQDDDDSSADDNSQFSDEDNSEAVDDEDDQSSETTSNDGNLHPDADVESEVSDDDDDDDDTIDPK